MKKLLCILLFFFCLISCDDSRQQKIACLLQEWIGKEIIFPSNSITMLLKTDTIPFSKPKTQLVILTLLDVRIVNCAFLYGKHSLINYILSAQVKFPLCYFCILKIEKN